MKRAVRRDKRRSTRPLYPVLLSAFGVALLGAIWSLQDIEEDEVEDVGETIGWESVAEFNPDTLAPTLWEEPVELRWKEGASQTSILQMHQVDRLQGDEDLKVDVRMDFHIDEVITGRGGAQLAWRQLSTRGIEVRHDDDEVISPALHRQLERGLGRATYELELDHRGRGDEARWLDGIDAGMEPLADLVVGLQRILTPRFPDEPVIVGERWNHGVMLPVAAVGESAPIDGTVEIENHLTGIYEDDRSTVAVISRRVNFHLIGERSDSPAAMKAGGLGTIYFDIDAGRLVASDLELHRSSSTPVDDASAGPVSTTIDAIWLPEPGIDFAIDADEH